MPGAGEMILGTQPGRGDLLLQGRIGTASPRVPASITTPGISDQPIRQRGVAAPEPLPVPRAPLYGTLALPVGEDGEGPPDGLTLDEAIERLVRENLDLRSKFMEIPQARADILTASLRANPILYADSQLVPYGSFSNRKPGGPTQYDLNISHPFDYSHKRRARIVYATQALKVTEAQYQDAVRIEINNLYTAFLDVLAARQTVRYARASVAGLERLLRATRLLYERDVFSRADVNQVTGQLKIAEVGVLDAEENLRRAKRTLGMMLNLSPWEAEALEVRGTIEDRGPPPPPLDEMVRLAQSCRPDVVSYRLGLQVARSGLSLQRANRYQDAYLLYQPYTFQNNAPFGRESATSWALGVTFPLPAYNRNQGNIERARLNIDQSRIELEGIERRVVTEVAQAAREYEVTSQIVARIRREIIPASEVVRDDRFKLFQSGEANVVSYLEAQRIYNDNVKAYHDTAVRHRRSMLVLNTVLGQRVLP
jgi:cobalt-zinc-cadmium efflux system outer membrane protein